MIVVIFMTSSSPLKTRFECIFYCVFDVGDFVGLSVRKISHLPTHRKISLGSSYFLWFAFQQDWFHLNRSFLAKVIEFQVSAVFSWTRCTAGLAGTTDPAWSVVPRRYRGYFHVGAIFFLYPIGSSFGTDPVVPPARYYRASTGGYYRWKAFSPLLPVGSWFGSTARPVLPGNAAVLQAVRCA